MTERTRFISYLLYGLFSAPEVIFHIHLREQGLSRSCSLNRNEPGDAIETCRHSFFDNETFFVFIAVLCSYFLLFSPTHSQLLLTTQKSRRAEKIFIMPCHYKRGAFGFRCVANFWFGFSVFAHTGKHRGFSVLVSCPVCGFSPIQSLVFGFCQQGWRFSGFFYPMHFTVFLVLPSAKIVIPRDHLYSVLLCLLEEWMTSLVCLVADIWVVTAAKQTMKSLR